MRRQVLGARENAAGDRGVFFAIASAPWPARAGMSPFNSDALEDTHPA